jgi:hypothetical protein
MTLQALGRTSPGSPERQTVIASLQNISTARRSTNSTGLAASRWSRGQLRGSRRRGWRGAGEALRPFADGDDALAIADPGAHQVRPQRGRRDLQVAAAPGDTVVVADAALFLARKGEPKRIRKRLAPDRDFSRFVL